METWVEALAYAAFSAHMWNRARGPGWAKVADYAVKARSYASHALAYGPSKPYVQYVMALLCSVCEGNSSPPNGQARYAAAVRYLTKCISAKAEAVAMRDPNAARHQWLLSGAEELRARVLSDFKRSVEALTGRKNLEALLKAMSKRTWEEGCLRLEDPKGLFSSKPADVFLGFGDKTVKKLMRIEPNAVTVADIECMRVSPEVAKLDPSIHKLVMKWQDKIWRLRYLLASSPSWLEHALVARPSAASSASSSQDDNSMTPVDLKVIGWNIQSSLHMHKITERLPAKVASLAALIAETKASLAVLSECPGKEIAGGLKVATTVQLLAAEALPLSWRCLPVETGKECAAFVFDTDVLKIVGEPMAFPSEEHQDFFQRPPAVALFEPSGYLPSLACEGLGLLAVCSVHLKSFDSQDGPLRARAELGRLAEAVVPWVEERMDKQASEAKRFGRTLLILGDFNLSYYDTGKNTKATAGPAWESLIKIGFKSLFEYNAPTNFGPPITQQDFAYDNALMLCKGSANRAASGSARVHPAMHLEQRDATRLLASLEEDDEQLQVGNDGEPGVGGVRRREWTAGVQGLVDQLKALVKLHWGDHKPIIIELSSTNQSKRKVKEEDIEDKAGPSP